MFSKLLKIIIIIAVVAIAVLIILQNSIGVDVSITKDYKIENINLGVVLISTFILGVLFASLFAVYFSLVNFVRRKKVEYEKKQKENFIKTVLEAREAYAEGNWAQAKSIWQSLRKKDSSGILANVEISKALEADNNLKEALSVIDKARTSSPKNIEVLFRAAELNLANGNKTAALDNLALILAQKSNQKSAILARDLSEDLNRFEDALEYNEKAIEADSLKDYQEVKERLEYKKLLANSDLTETGRESFTKALTKFVKKHSKCTDAILKLAEIEHSGGNTDRAAELLYKASQVTNSSELWHEAVGLWIEANSPDRAIATAKSAIKSTKGVDRLKTELDYIRVLITLNKNEDVEKSLCGFLDLAEKEEVEVPSEVSKEYLILKGLYLNRSGEYKESARIWKKLSNSDFKVEACSKEAPKEDGEKAPAPRLSTP